MSFKTLEGLQPLILNFVLEYMKTDSTFQIAMPMMRYPNIKVFEWRIKKYF